MLYYIIAKYTIEIPGYKYFTFFGIDVKALQSTYLNYIFSITGHHIEILSIFIFFVVILAPLFYYNEVAMSLICIFLIFLFFLRKVFKYRLNVFKNKTQTLGNLCVA
jgi:hypothetical protein